MRPLVVLVLAPILALGLVVSAGVLVPDDPSTNHPKPQSIVWANRVFTSRAQFARWLERHHKSYAEWVKLHPSATWFHHQPSLVGTTPAKPASVKAAEVDRHFARIFVGAGFGLLALLLVAAVVQSGRGRRPRFRRARVRLEPLKPAPARALGEADRSTPASPARAPEIAFPTAIDARPNRAGASVVPLYTPPEPEAEPVVVRPAASREAPVLEFRSAFAAEPAPVAHREPPYESDKEPQLLVVAEPAVVSWSEAREPEPRLQRERAREPELTREPERLPALEAEPDPKPEWLREPEPDPEPEVARDAEPAPEAEQDVSVKDDAPLEPPATEPRATEPAPPVVHASAGQLPHPPPVVRPKRDGRAKRPAPTKPTPITPPVAAPTPADAPAAASPQIQAPAAPTHQAVDGAKGTPAAADALLICEIDIWQGYLKSQFYARAVGPDGQEYAVAESDRFRSKNPPERDETAVTAHAHLTEQLAKLGWKPDGHGPEWWSARFRLDDGAAS